MSSFSNNHIVTSGDDVTVPCFHSTAGFVKQLVSSYWPHNADGNLQQNSINKFIRDYQKSKDYSKNRQIGCIISSLLKPREALRLSTSLHYLSRSSYWPWQCSIRSDSTVFARCSYSLALQAKAQPDPLQCSWASGSKARIENWRHFGSVWWHWSCEIIVIPLLSLFDKM